MIGCYDVIYSHWHRLHFVILGNMVGLFLVSSRLFDVTCLSSFSNTEHTHAHMYTHTLSKIDHISFLSQV